MLLKATAGVPHEGGQRTKVGEKYYEMLRSWIADGAKLDLKAPRVTKIEVFPHDPVVQMVGSRQQVRVVATFSDGKTRDVTAESFVESGNSDVAKTDGGGLIDTLRRGEAPLLARYEGNYVATTLTVMGDRTGFAWQQPETWSRIDELVAAKWERMKIQPSDLCSDADFLRRVYLDLTGLPPSAEEMRAFVAETSPAREKRNAVIDKLIGSPAFIEHWTNKWSDMLQVNSKFLGGEGAKNFRAWIREQVANNKPYDQFVREILTATGSTKDNPAANYWKILREPAEAMENTTHLFLATRFNCNKCHDHPFERWTQDQYYRLGAYFTQVQLTGDPASGKAIIAGTAVEKARPLYEIVKDTTVGDMIHLRTNKIAPPTFPFETKIETPVAEKAPRREQLAAWMTSADNRFFAASYVNRLWGYLTGVGVIEPLDDIRAGNPPTNPELLDYLKTEFINHGFDVRHVPAPHLPVAHLSTRRLHQQVERGRQDQLFARHGPPSARGSALRRGAQSHRRHHPSARWRGRAAAPRFRARSAQRLPRQSRPACPRERLRVRALQRSPVGQRHGAARWPGRGRRHRRRQECPRQARLHPDR